MRTINLKSRCKKLAGVHTRLIASKRFRHDEDGGATLLTLYLLFIILLIASFGVDVMRQEMHRAKLQANLDAAVLSAATVPYDEDPDTPDAEDRLKDHFKKAGLEDALHAINEGDIVVTQASAKVSASASETLDTHLMRLTGVETLSAAAASTARTSVQQLEIALVLDVSGSMAGDRLDALQDAAKDFVTQILNNSEGGKVAFSIVPYSFNAPPPAAIYNALSANTTHHYTRCLSFDDGDFADPYIDPDRDYAQTIYTSVDYGSWNNADFGTVGNGDIENGYSSAYNSSCYADPRFEILAYSSNEADLHDKIDALTAAGGTSSDMGVKWGAALLDPKFQPVATALQANTQDIPEVDNDGNLTTTHTMLVDSDFETLPESYSSPKAMKIMVVMGDGANSNTYLLSDPNNLLDPDVPESHASSDYRGPNSNLYLLNEPAAAETEMVFVRATTPWGHVSYSEWLCGAYWYWTCEYNEVEVGADMTGQPEPSFYLYSPSSHEYIKLDPDQGFSDGDRYSTSEFNAKIDELTEYNGNLSNLSAGFNVAVDTIDLAEETLDYVEENFTQPEDKFYERFSWEEAWGLMTPYEYGDISGDWGAYNQYNSGSSSRLTPYEKNSRMEDVCNAADNEGVTIYTIAFELGEGDTAAEELEKCASTPANHFISTTLDINQTFGAIASNVMALKLTQ
ncbi:VWA domain-containing protein [Roseovarius sp. A21]|uniref:VWA domain-containing protein n=1 Tax=Roseovarius bejariae TaxID=2576383 RepID=A0A844D0W3_9RHOB|nr:VWA domain-containing protein [Roseovarius bejariae]MRU16470.1 VWA domain-containing protein [Roseovarius bejariae]